MSAPHQSSDGVGGNGMVSRSTLSIGVIVGISAGVTIGVLLAVCVLLGVRIRRKRSKVQSREIAIPMRMHGADSSTIFSDTGISPSPPPKPKSTHGFWKRSPDYIPGITKYSYRELQKATHNFTTLLGQGAFGSVYKAIIPSSDMTLAVKVLSHQSKQGEREFRTEVMLLGRLHHRNLVNLLGYCVDRGECMLVYEYMSNGSLEKLLYDDKGTKLSWAERVQIAKDISRGIEYLHDGAVPPVIHRDIKSANILLDADMTGRVADFGLSKEVSPTVTTSGIRGTYGYVDPDYLYTRNFTEKSDIYSFGVLLFELISGRSPQQSLLEYVHLAAMGADGSEGWSEILDSGLNGKCNHEELKTLASVAYRCIRNVPSRRPRMREVVQSLLTTGNRQQRHQHNRSSSASIDLDCSTISEI